MANPGEYTVNALLEYADENPDEVQSLLDAEKAGENRATAVAGLESRLSAAPEADTEEADEEVPEGEEGVDWYRRDDGEVFRLDDGSDEYIAKLTKEGKI